MPPTVRWRRASPVSVPDREDTANRNPLLTNRASARTTSDGEHDCRLYAFRVARFSDEFLATSDAFPASGKSISIRARRRELTAMIVQDGTREVAPDCPVCPKAIRCSDPAL